MSTSRRANLLGALALGLTDLIREAGETETRFGGEGAAALVVIGQAPGTSIRSLSTALRLTHPGTVRLVDKLAAAGLVRRRPVLRGADRRAVALTLTAAGRRTVKAVLAARERRLQVALANLTAGEQVALTPLLEKLLAGLTTSEAQGDALCRLCDLAACPQSHCPVEERHRMKG
jgi:DNA-binding MarR family transcriptional regulator